MEFNYDLNENIIVTSLVFKDDNVIYTVRYKEISSRKVVPIDTFKKLGKLPISAEVTRDIFNTLLFSVRYKMNNKNDIKKLDELISKYKLK